MKSKRMGIVIGAVVILLLGVVCFWIFSDFDAQRYVESLLNQNFKGNVEMAAKMIEGKSEEELYQQYEDGITSFVESNITGGMEIDSEMQEKYTALCKEIFASMKYEVLEAEKISRKEYHVPVKYQTSDVFKVYSADSAEEIQKMKDKIEKGEYKGTEEEIYTQMQQEMLSNNYAVLQNAYESMQYAEAETMIFTVKEGASGLFTVDDAQVYKFVVKIMGLDEIQD